MKRSITRDVGPLSFRAMFAPATLDKEKRTVQVTWTTGARVQRGGFFTEPFLEELSLDRKHVRMGRLQSGRAPLLDSHNAQRIADSLGVVQDAQIDNGGGAGSATVRFDSGPGGTDAMRRIGEGTLSDISVGYRIYKMKKMPDDEASEMPVYRAVDWEPHELSLTPMGADVDSHARAANTNTNPCEFIEETSMKTPPTERTATDADLEDKTPNTDGDKRARKAERERCDGIRRIGAALKTAEDVIQRAIDDETSLADFRAQAQDAYAAKETINFERRIEGGPDLTRAGAVDGLRNALLHRTDPSKFKLEDVGRSYRGLTMLEAARAFLEAHGTRTAGMSKNDLAGLALGLGTRAGSHSTSDFPLVLADVAGKTLRRAYDEAPQTFQAFSRRVSLPDFKQVKRTQLGEAPTMTKVLEGGEFTRGTIGEGREVYQLATYGKVFSITRQALINDDTDAFSRVPMLFGRSARDLESDLVYTHFLSNPTMGDTVALFNAAHGNVGTGAISIAAIGAGRTAMRKQRGLDKKQRINVQVKYLLVPAALETTAEQFVSTNLAANQASNINVFAGRLQVVAEPRLDDTSVAEWYLTGDAAAIDTLEYGYLDGEDGPFLESRVGFDVDGFELKARHDFAAKVIDWRGFYKSSGV